MKRRAQSHIQRRQAGDFCHTPRTGSQATHILLRDVRLDFRPHKVAIFSHALEDGSDYTRANPNGYVPALVLGDGMLPTENAAIIDWIASQSTGLLPEGKLGRTRHLQVLAFLSTEVQKPFIPLFFLEDEAEQARLRGILARRFHWLASKLEYPCWSRKGCGPFAAVPEQGVCQHDHFSHDGCDGDFRGFAGREELVIFRLEIGIEAHGDESRHVERLTDIGPAATHEGAASPLS
ncbi:hypothetical protein ACLKMW_25075 [Pseudaminobacter sp. NGMCC 1.201702]|uniref:hypothetical protein n=1 Tax=Pseudaminobacter sp. NGMCC 1.201702 TaxID=3391825 RepID=UPI0039F12341